MIGLKATALAGNTGIAVHLLVQLKAKTSKVIMLLN